MKPSEQALAQAIEYESQARAERAPHLIAYCEREAMWWLNHAAELEREGQ